MTSKARLIRITESLENKVVQAQKEVTEALEEVIKTTELLGDKVV